MRKQPGYLEKGKRRFLTEGKRGLFARPAPREPVGDVEPAPDPQFSPDFDLAGWRVRPALGRLTRADRIARIEDDAMRVLLVLAEQPDVAVRSDVIAARIWSDPLLEARVRAAVGELRRAFASDDQLRIASEPGPQFTLITGNTRSFTRVGESTFVGDGMEAWQRVRRRRRWLFGAGALAIVAGLGWGIVELLGGPAEGFAGQVEKIAVLEIPAGRVASPSFSQDGSQLVFSLTGDTGTADLYVRAVGVAGSRQLTTDPADDRYPAWAPQGGLVAFMRVDKQDCGVYVVPAAGGEERRLAECAADVAGPLAWTSDGTGVVFPFHTDPVLPAQLVVATLVTAPLEAMTSPTSGMPGDSQPALSAANRRMAFVRQRTLGYEDALLLETGMPEVQRLTQDGATIRGLAWEPGARSLVAATDRIGTSALWRVRLDGKSPQPLVQSANDLTSPSMTPDGKHLAFIEARVTTRLLRVAIDNAALEPQEWQAPVGRDWAAQFSPDGRLVAFVSDRSGASELWLAAADGSGARQLSKLGGRYVGAPRWSPDGRHLLFATAVDNGAAIRAIAIASGKVTAVTDGASRNEVPSWSRDGQWLYFASDRTGRFELWRQGWAGAPTGKPEQVTQNGGYAALESRDGSLLYFVRPDRNGLWQRPREPGGDDHLVTPDLAAVDWNNWLVTEDAIWFVKRPDPDIAQLMRLDISTESAQPMRSLARLYQNSGLTLTPDGHEVLIAQVVGTTTELKLATLE